ncbi:hypothetical protein NEMIN01_0412 [Nematocida minor]|uniref:uncharacterized protein n=1 Tax=Nematocida minor TaxID=1912983 RepID=UPI00221FB567|nr:uncharacterized protein NEMIN01_0412 [Nematocida minor]KAI5189246.1 hypothetical protein NEMIN01_0412 [Nematocida minor]
MDNSSYNSTNMAVPEALMRSLHEVLARNTSMPPDFLSSSSPEELSAHLFPLIFDRSISLVSRMIVLKVYTFYSFSVPSDFSLLLIRELTVDSNSPAWINELLSACIHFSINSPDALKMLQSPNVFLAVQAVYRVCPYKSVLILIRLINQELFSYLDDSLFNSSLLQMTTGIIHTNVLVLLGYAEGYRQRSLPNIPEDASLEGQKVHTQFSNCILGDIFISLLKHMHSPLVLPLIGFLAETSKGALKYLESSPAIVKAIKEEYTKGPEKERNILRINHFLIPILPKSKKIVTSLAEAGLIDAIVDAIENNMKKEIFTAETVSSFCVLKIFARDAKVTANYLTTYRITNLLEKMAKTAHKHYREEGYDEIVLSINEYFLLMGNLVIFNKEWKQTAVQSVVPEIVKYLSVESFAENSLKFLCSLLFECSPDLIKSLVTELPIAEIRGTEGGIKEKMHFIGILKNILSNTDCLDDSSDLIEQILAEVLIINETIKEIIRENKKEVKLLPKLCSDILLVLSNAAIVSNTHRLDPSVIDLSIEVLSHSADTRVFACFLSYLENILYLPTENVSKPSETAAKEYMELPERTVNQIAEILKKEQKKDAEIDFRITKLIPKISQNKAAQGEDTTLNQNK